MIKMRLFFTFLLTFSMFLKGFTQTDTTVHYFEKLYPDDGLFLTPNSLPDGKWIAFCSSNKTQIGLIVYYKNGKQEGESKGFWPNGNLKFKQIYKNGYADGNGERWYENGTKKSEGNCRLVNSSYKYSTCSIINFWTKDGEQTMKDSSGIFIDYHDNGVLQIKGQYINGQRNGDWIWYYPNGKIQYTSSYINGKEVGVWKYYKEDGTFEYENEHKK